MLLAKVLRLQPENLEVWLVVFRFVDVLGEHCLRCGRMITSPVAFRRPKAETDTFTHVIAAADRIITTEGMADVALRCLLIEHDAQRPVLRTMAGAGCQDSVGMLFADFTAKSTRYAARVKVHRGIRGSF